MSNPTGLEPTQTRRPWRATLRTALQVGIPTIILLPTIIQMVIEELGPNLPPSLTAWLVAAGVFMTALASLFARLMAIPQVELLLRRLPGAAFAAQPLPKPEDNRGEGGYLHILSSTWPMSAGTENTTPVHGPSRDRTLPGKTRIRARRNSNGA